MLKLIQKEKNKIKESKKNKLTGLTRNTIDKFYTKDEIVKMCYNEIKPILNIDNEKDLIIEPSAGNGAFIKIIKKLCNNYKFYDLMPEDDNIKKQDYLLLDYKKFENNYNKIHIIGNPPFGRQSSTALKFIKYSANYCDSISFILPKSFKKDSLKNKIPLLFHCVYEMDLPDNSFKLEGKDYDAPSVFQIWIKQKKPRYIKQKLLPIGYSFVKKEEPHDISFRRVGVNAGKINTSTHDKSIQSHYFIKFDKKITDTLFKKLSNTKFDTSTNTVGPKSISKQELIVIYNSVIK